MIALSKLEYRYKNKESRFAFPNLVLEDAKDLLVLGKSGVGKTTWMHLMAGLLKPARGSVCIDNVDIFELTTKERDRFRGQHIGLVFQKKHAIQSLHVLDNIHARLFLSKKKIDPRAINLLLERLDLLAHKKSRIYELSEGQLQRLNIAMAVVHQPKVIFADEPTSSLDTENSKIVIDLLQEQAAQTKANLVVISHDTRIQSLFSKTVCL
ncbi:MAG: ATP-binding cassette domain-containing protein [Flavobacteriaceae bacterium]|nr:ATP-binding cassette domain-containing protein [Flavobacteriaceae bacterium]